MKVWEVTVRIAWPDEVSAETVASDVRTRLSDFRVAGIVSVGKPEMIWEGTVDQLLRGPKELLEKESH